MTPRPASLPMYDADRAAVQAWWHALAAAMRAEGLASAPAQAAWPADLAAHWRDPSLLLSQTCGYPLVTGLLASVQVVGAFHYDAPGCSGMHYRSELVVRAGDAGAWVEDFRGRVAVVNDPASHSGSNALKGVVAPLADDGGYFRDTVVSGSHRRSLDVVRSGQADLAAIDCITLAGLMRHDPASLAGLRVLGCTPLAPGLPLITAKGTTVQELAGLRLALRKACADPGTASLRAALFIAGFEVVAPTAWQPIADIRRRVAARQTRTRG